MQRISRAGVLITAHAILNLKSKIKVFIDLLVGCRASLVALAGAGGGIATFGDEQLSHVGAVV